MPSRASKPEAMSSRKRKRKQQKQAHSTPLLPPDVAEDEVEISDEDIRFVTRHRQYAGFLSKLDTSTITKQVLGLRTDKEDKDLETYYEKKTKRVSLSRDEDAEVYSVEPVDALPIKTLSGELQYCTSHIEKGAGKKESSLSLEDRKALVRMVKPSITIKKGHNELVTGSEQDRTSRVGIDEVQKKKLTKAERKREQKRSKKENKENANEEGNNKHGPQALNSLTLEELRIDVSEEERIAEVRARMAELGTGVLADPENNLESLKELQELCADKDESIASLAMLSLLAVFKDIAPGYRIRLPTPKELEMQVSKEVQKLRDYEGKLLRLYQKYLQTLISSVKSGLHFKTALRCMCGLLEAIPHFNFRDSLLAAVIPQMDSSDDVCSAMSCEAVRSLFRSEGKHGGDATVEAVQMIADLVKVNDCVLRPDTVRVFLALSFDDDLRRPSSDLEKDKGRDKQTEKLKSKRLEKKDNKSKKHQLAAKLRDEVVADFKESSASRDASERRRLQTLTLSAVFETYFRILKTSLDPSDRVNDFKAKAKLAEFGLRPLLRPCLDGLGKFSHLISVEFMGDLLGVLKRLAAGNNIQKAANEMQTGIPFTVTDRLQCCVVAFRIVRNNLDALNIDLRDFYVPFYNLLLGYNPVRDELDGVVLAEALQVMLWESRQQDMQRVAAFVKRLASESLQLGSSETMAVLVTVRHLLQRYKKCCNILENDGGGGAIGGNIAVFQGDGSDPDLSGALSSILWEITLLCRHYHPGVAKLASQISTMGTTSEDIFLATMTPKDAVLAYSTSEGGFRPSVQPPKKPVKKKSYLNQHGVSLEANLKVPFDVSSTDLRTSDEETNQMFASHFKIIRDIKENEALRKELNRAVMSLELYKQFKARKRSNTKKA